MPGGQPPSALTARHTLHELVRERLRSAILSGDLPEGAHLVQADIARQLKVSTTPVREALGDLVADGLAISRPHVGTVVRQLDVAELTELYEARKLLDAMVVRRAAERITRSELTKAAAIQREIESCTNDPVNWVELNRRFHESIDAAGRSPLLAPIRKRLQEMAAVYIAHSARVSGSWSSARCLEHRALLAALRARDGEQAATVHTAHLQATLDALVAGALGRPGAPQRVAPRRVRA